MGKVECSNGIVTPLSYADYWKSCPKGKFVAIKHRDTLCSDLSEYVRNEPDSWLLLLQWEVWGVSAGRSTRVPWSSFWLLLFSPCPSG